MENTGLLFPFPQWALRSWGWVQDHTAVTCTPKVHVRVASCIISGSEGVLGALWWVLRTTCTHRPGA